jgi:hypothetical protein
LKTEKYDGLGTGLTDQGTRMHTCTAISDTRKPALEKRVTIPCREMPEQNLPEIERRVPEFLHKAFSELWLEENGIDINGYQTAHERKLVISYVFCRIKSRSKYAEKNGK